MKSIKRGRASSMTSGIVGIVMSMAFFGIAMQVSDGFGEFAFMPIIMGLIVLGVSIAEVLFGYFGHEYVLNIDFSLTDQCQQQIERPFEVLERYFISHIRS